MLPASNELAPLPMEHISNDASSDDRSPPRDETESLWASASSSTMGIEL